MNEVYEFGGFRLEVQNRRLLYGERPVQLTPKQFELLLTLVESGGRIVGKTELLEKVWADVFVEEGTLTRNISWLRKKLAAHAAHETELIETVSKNGYRLLPQVTECGAETIIVSEQTVRRIEIEESIEITPEDDEIFPVRRESFAVHLPNDRFADEEIHESDFKALPAAPNKNNSSRRQILAGGLIFSIIVIFAAVLFGYFSSAPKVILASKIVPFAGLPGRENMPAFSPDGRQMVFTWDGGAEGANPNIYLKLLGAGDPVRLTNTPNEEINPVFSPDGKTIAFVRVFPTHNEIILMNALGGAERKLDENASYASLSFSSDGSQLACADLNLSKTDGADTGIFTVNLQTGEKTKITKPAAPAVDHTPRYSPDGKYLAFIRYFSSFKREIFIVSASGGEPRQITSDDRRIYGLAWNPDGGKLFFTSFRQNDQLNLWQIPAAGGEPQLISTGGKDLQDVTISPDGKTAAFVEESADDNIWELKANRPPRLLIRSNRADHSQQFSPDGTQIAFVSDRTGNYEVWLADADGKNQRQLTDSTDSAGSPRFSPDGKQLVFDAQRAGSSDIFIVSVNGGAPIRLTEGNSYNSLPAWSKDGQMIFFLSNRSGSDQIWQIPANGGAAQQITRQGAFEMFAAPDGKSIIYSKSVGKAGLWRIGTDGTEEKPIFELTEAGGWRSWTVTEQGVYYTAFAAQPPFHIKFFDFAARQTKQIADFGRSPLVYYSNLSVSPDHQNILYAMQDQSTSTIMLAELK